MHEELLVLRRPTPLRVLSVIMGLVTADIPRCIAVCGDVLLCGDSALRLYTVHRRTILGERFDIRGRGALIPWIDDQLRLALDVRVVQVDAARIDKLICGPEAIGLEQARGLAAKMEDELRSPNTESSASRSETLFDDDADDDDWSDF